MRILILIQLLAGFVLAMLGVILMIHLDVFTGVLLTFVGAFFMIRATNRVTYIT